MRHITYVILPSKDAPLDFDREYDTYQEAVENADSGQAIVALTYEFSDSELVEVIP